MSIDILGLRQVPARGRMRAPECLPRGAKLSRDGRFEILEASVPVPPGDVSLATVQQTRHGLDITVPLRHLRLNRVTPKTGDQKDQKDQSVDQGVDQSGHGAHGVHRGQRPDQNDAAMPRPKHWAESRATSEVPNESKVSLPPSDGIEIVEEEYEYPEKDADASEGWVDIRGEFQSY